MQRPTKHEGSSGPVAVIYFPKRVRPTIPSRATQTIPEIRVIDEVVTEAEAVMPEARRTPQLVRRVTGEKKRRKTKETALPETTLAAVVAGRKTPQEVADLSLFGHQLFEMGRVDEARVIFEGLVGASSKDGFAHTMLGTIYLALKDQTKALTLFEVSLQINPDDVSALVYRGEIRLNRGKMKGALDDLTRALKVGEADDPFVDRAGRLLKMAKTLLKRARR